MNNFHYKLAEYLPLVLQVLLTILVLNHWYRDLNYFPILMIWTICLGLTIIPILNLFNFYGSDEERICHQCNSYINDEMLSLGSYKCENCFDSEYDNYLSDSQYDPTDQLPHKEEMEEEYQPY